MAPVTQADPWKKFEGEVLDGKLLLQEYLDGDDRQGVFLSTLDSPGARKVAIKLIRDDPRVSKRRLQQWKFGEKLSHPHLLKLFGSGRSEIRGEAMLYVVMEYADENLGQVIPHRTLNADEACEMLAPAVKALAYLHREGFIHGHLQPSNILAVDGTLRLSSDHLGRTGDQDEGKPGPYAPPEIDLEGFSPPGDVWSLGMTLAEALTQKRPVWEGTASEEPVLAGAIPQPLLEIARNCLRRNPRSRWKTADIEKRLGRTSSGSSVEAIEKPARPAAPPKRLIFALSAVLTVVLAFVLFGPRIFSRVESPALNAAPSEPVPAPKATPPAPAVNRTPDPPPAPAVPVVDKQPDKSPAPIASAKVTPPPPPEPKPREPEPAPAATAPSTESIQKVMPDVNGKARASIHGRVRVTIRVHVDATGKVLDAEIQSQGPSKYFADAALQSSRRWKFPPGDATRAYDVQYIFERSETIAVPARVAGQ